MKPHVKIYTQFFGYHREDMIPCEIKGCQRRATDVHHIHCRGMGGSKDKDTIENLIGLCREHHIEYGDKKQHFDFLTDTHSEFMKLFRR